MRIRNILIFLCVALVSVIGVSAQDGEQSGMIKSAKGVLVVWNEPGNYYTIEIIGKTINPAGQPPPIYFQVDGHFLQIHTAEKNAFLKDKKEKALDDKAVLTAYRDWEADYLSGLLGNKLKIDSEWIKLPNGSDALAWSYDVPKKFNSDNKSSAKKQLYLTVVKRDHVLGLNSAVTDEDNNEKTLRQLLLDTVTTLKSSEKPLNMKKAAEQILKEK